jgi:hypothetical protein
MPHKRRHWPPAVEAGVRHKKVLTMNRLFIVIIALLSCMLINGCAYYGVRYGIDKQTADIPWVNQLSNNHLISSKPIIDISSWCTSKGYDVVVGPYIGIPWLIFPSIFGIAEHYSDEDRQSTLIVSVKAPPTEDHARDAVITLYINNEVAPASEVEATEDYWQISRVYNYNIGLSCSELAEKEIVVVYSSTKQNITSEVIKVHKMWGFHAELW